MIWNYKFFYSGASEECSVKLGHAFRESDGMERRASYKGMFNLRDGIGNHDLHKRCASLERIEAYFRNRLRELDSLDKRTILEQRFCNASDSSRKRYFCQAAASFESPVTDNLYGIWDVYADKTLAVLKRAVTDLFHALGYGDPFQRKTAFERAMTYRSDAFRNLCIGTASNYSILLLVNETSILRTVVMIILMNLNALQRTSCERMKSDFSYALRNVYVGDALAIFEGPGPDFLNKVRYRRGFQASTSLERTPYNLFHAVWKDDVLKRCAAVEGMHGYLLNAIGQDDLSKTGTIRECAYTSILQRAGKFYPLKGLTSAESAFINLSQCGGEAHAFKVPASLEC